MFFSLHFVDDDDYNGGVGDFDNDYIDYGEDSGIQTICMDPYFDLTLFKLVYCLYSKTTSALALMELTLNNN